MLKALSVNNYAIIDEIHIDFSSELNAITGETGAGKSILMGALSLILGERADTTALLSREKKCIVEGVFSCDNNITLQQLLEKNDLLLHSNSSEENAEEIIVRREISPNGKSRAFINDTPVTLEILRQVSAMLVDLHRQFDTLAIAGSDFQREVLDALAGNTLLLTKYKELYKQWRLSLDEWNQLLKQKSAFNKELDYHQFLYAELEEAALAEKELEEAEVELKLLSNAEAIKSVLSNSLEVLNQGEQPLVQQLKAVGNNISSYGKYLQGLDEVADRIRSAQIEVQDIADELERLSDRIVHKPDRIEQLNERLAIGYKLLKKHGVQTTEELLTIQRSLSEKLQEVMNIDTLIIDKEKETTALFERVQKTADTISKQRALQIKPLQEKVAALLTRVGMPNAALRVSIADKEHDAFGKDEVEFLFDANKSGKFEPVRKVASGGELSRLMLSIKSLVAESMDMPTLIFDEIDTGISGEAARQVGFIMKQLAESRQIITITHQPQIAGKATRHFFVYKEINNDKVSTHIRTLTDDDRVTVIAQMLSGEKPTAAALENAREMIMH